MLRFAAEEALPLPTSRLFALWGSYTLLNSDPLEGRAAPQVVKLNLRRPELPPADENIDSVDAWPLDSVFKNLLGLLVDRRLSAELTRRFASATALRDWINSTREVADTLPFGGPSLREHMRAVAERVERVQGWPSRFLRTPPRGKVGDEAFRQDAILWVLESLRRAVNESEQKAHGGNAPFQLSSAGFFDTLRRDAAVETREAFEDDRIRERLEAFQANLREGSAADLMFEVLNDALRHGPYLPDGSLRPDRRT
jgi:hypothetical protein